MLNICHISTMTRWGGVERMLSDMLEQVSQKAITHHLIVTSQLPEITERIRKANIPFFVPARRFRFDPTAIFQMARWLRQRKIAVVHTYNVHTNIWGGMAARLAGIPIVLTGEHGTVWKTQHLWRKLDAFANRSASAIIANSDASSKMLQIRYGVLENKIKIVLNAVEANKPVNTLKLRDKFKISPTQIVVGTIGRLDTPKHFTTFIDAAELILSDRPDIKFILVGGGPNEIYLRDRINSASLSEKIIITGWRDDARELLQMFDIFVSTSIRESFGNVLVEAILAGVPVIAPMVDGIPEALLNGNAGVLLEPTIPVTVKESEGATPLPENVLIMGKLQSPLALSPKLLAEEILKLSDSAEMRSTYSANAKQLTKNRYSLHRYTGELEAIYQQLAKANNKNNL